MSRELFLRRALDTIPKILTLQDRNPHSPTAGCFDRNFWHYKIIDFPSGMAQELVWPLALAWQGHHPENPYDGSPAVAEAVRAGVRFAVRSGRRDGSCDDYFPFERAAGAAAFSLLAGVEACAVLGWLEADVLAFFARRAGWLARHRESGRLSNHEALIALALHRTGELLGDSRWEAARDGRLARVLSWQHPEGWFQEYDGADPGYQTLTIWALARLHRDCPQPELRRALERGVRFAAEFVHPDGSYGGEYGSRNTYNFFPHGFELVGRWLPEALAVNDRFLAGLAAGRAPCYADDHILGHHAWNDFLAWQDFVAERPPCPPRPAGRRVFPAAGLLVDRRKDAELYLALGKGGVFKLFRAGRLVASDTQVSVLTRSGNAVGHLMGPCRHRVEEDEIEVAGDLGWAKQTQMTTAKLVLLRGVMLSVGRFFPNLVRRLLQRLLITGRDPAPFSFRRRLRWVEGRWHVRDEVRSTAWGEVREVGQGGHQTSIHVVMSRTFQVGQLQPWQDLTPQVHDLGPGEPLVVERPL